SVPSFLFHCYGDLRDLHSFPTRRSSDLDVSNKTVETNKNNDNNKIKQNVSVDVTADVTKAVEKAGKSVVGITNLQVASFWSSGESTEAGTGSGVIYKRAGDSVYIVTNHHVVEGASQIEVTL